MFTPKKILAVGDLMLDLYTFGSVERISPEAPIPILHVSEERRHAGGVGNAILNLRSLGMQVVALSRVGDDAEGALLLAELESEGVDVSGVVVEKSFPTPRKNRMIASGQQIVRVDHESTSPLSPFLEKRVIERLALYLEEIAVVAISDYAKGFLTPTLLSALIGLTRERGIPLVVDPKGVDFGRYHGATLIKPNLLEATLSARLAPGATIDQIAEQILADVAIDHLMITRSSEGISLFSHEEGRHDFPARLHQVKDVTGAGDTVLAVVTASLASGLDLKEASELANVAAGIAISRLGCARVTATELEAQNHRAEC